MSFTIHFSLFTVRVKCALIDTFAISWTVVCFTINPTCLHRVTLYHYTNGQGIYGIINSDELHCSNVNFLNDPSEKSYFQDLLKPIFEDSKVCERIYSTLFNGSYQKAVVDPFDTFVASFSKNDDSLSMWNYYAKGNGYNIGLNIDEIIEQNRDSNLFIQKIELNYCKQKQIEDTLEFILSQKNNSDTYIELDEKIRIAKKEDDYYEFSRDQDYLIEEFNEGIHELMLGFKHHAYEPEQEVRLLISENKAEQETTRFKISENGVFVEYLPLKLNLRSSLKSISIHPLNGKLHLEGVKKFIASKDLSTEIEFNVSKIPFRIV